MGNLTSESVYIPQKKPVGEAILDQVYVLDGPSFAETYRQSGVELPRKVDFPEESGGRFDDISGPLFTTNIDSIGSMGPVYLP